MPAGESEREGTSLEEILWRAMDRFREKPALVDAEEFADHIARAFDAWVPEEAFAEHFFADADRLHRRQPETFAEVIVRASSQRLHVYEFDLDRLEYVIVEDDDGLVVVSDSGQFATADDGSLGRSLAGTALEGPAAGEPRAWFVRRSGEVLGVDVRKVARALERVELRQISMPPVDSPGRRLSPFHPVRRPMSERREERALLQHPLLARPLSPGAAPQGLAAALPQGSVGVAGVGGARRWERMLRQRAGPGQRRLAVQAGRVLAIFSGGPRRTAGERALEEGDALAAVRASAAPVAALATREAVRALSAQANEEAPAGRPRYWVQPEEVFGAETATPERTLAAQPLQLGQITGDPWGGWALAVGTAPRATWWAAGNAGETPVAAEPGRAPWSAGPARTRAWGGGIAGAPPAFVGSDAERNARPAFAAYAPLTLRTSAAILPRSGALPAVAIQSLQLALERTAAFGGYRLPQVHIDAAPGAIATGRALALEASDDRRRRVHLAAPPGVAGQAARLVLSMPFPNRGELHVGSDLSDALQAYLAGPVVPAALRPAAGPAPARGRGAHPATHAPRAVPGAPPRGTVVALELVRANELAGGVPSLSGLPSLFRRALSESGSWTRGPGAPLPLSIREVQPALAGGTDGSTARGRRPPGPGEEEIVIPLPLWAQLGRGASDATPPFSRPVPAGLSDSGGRAVTAAVGPARRAAPIVAPAGEPAVSVAFRPATRVAGASAEGAGQADLAAVAGPGEAAAPAEGRRRIRIGAPIAPGQDAAVIAGAASPRIRDRRSEGVPATAPAAAGRSAPGIVAAPAPARGTAGLPVAARDVLPASAALDGRRWLLAGPAEASGVTAPAGRARPAAQPFVALRFRYVSTPFWWSMGNRPESLQPSAALSDVPAAGGAGAGAAAAAIWRSLLAASGPERGATPVPAVSAGRPIGGFDAFVAAVPQAGQPAGAPAYIAMSSAGAAGTVPASAAARARAQAIEMSIVAAIPPAPPPLETMGSSAGPAEAPRARRGQAQDAAHGRHKEAEDAVSHSKIEGSVDAIAQRIYHRIRRRLQSDRERFGG